jgi:hypothetical protein
MKEWKEIRACADKMLGSDVFNLQPLAVVLFLPRYIQQAVLNTLNFTSKPLIFGFHQHRPDRQSFEAGSSNSQAGFSAPTRVRVRPRIKHRQLLLLLHIQRYVYSIATYLKYQSEIVDSPPRSQPSTSLVSRYMQSLAAKVCPPPPPIQATEKSPLIPLHGLLAQAVLVVPRELNQPESTPLLHRSLIAPLIAFLLQSSIQVWPLE